MAEGTRSVRQRLTVDVKVPTITLFARASHNHNCLSMFTFDQWPVAVTTFVLHTNP